MKIRMGVYIGIILTSAILLILNAGVARAEELLAVTPADGFHCGIGNPSTGCILTTGTPLTNQNVDIDDGDDILVTIDLLLSVNNNFIGGSDYTQMDYSINFYEKNSGVNIDHSVSDHLRVTGTSGSSGTPECWTYDNLNQGDSMMVIIDLDLYVYQVPPGACIAWLFPGPFTFNITTY